MKLVKYRPSSGAELVGHLEDDRVIPVSINGRQYRSLFDILEADDPQEVIDLLGDRSAAVNVSTVTLLAPIDQHEIWAAGVTYKRSQKGRMEESEAAADCYDRVYSSPRPELFFKASPHRVVGPGQPIRIRSDSKWNVPEPELALVLNTKLELVGATIGNDVSSRDIEGENPLYLPQAKVYDACCAIGPCITLPNFMPGRPDIKISLTVIRDGKEEFNGETSAGEMARTFGDLVKWLGIDNSFPNGVILLTGTGIVPDKPFTLTKGDRVEITIAGIGTLANPVTQG
jgi:2-dehydro-3-deoxy-D-arabinonate dehydratase